MTAAFEQISALLWDVTPTELQKVKALIGVMSEGNEEISGGHYADEIYHGYESAAAKRNLMIQGIPTISRSKDYKKFKGGEAERVGKWIEVNFRATEITTLRLACIEAASCLMDWLDSFDAPTSATTLLRNTANIPTAVNFCYPGYAEHGTLHNTIRQRDSQVIS